MQKRFVTTFISRDPLQKRNDKNQNVWNDFVTRSRSRNNKLLIRNARKGSAGNKQVTTLNANSLSKSRRDATLRDVDKLSSTTTDTLPNFFFGKKEKTDPDVQTHVFFLLLILWVVKITRLWLLNVIKYILPFVDMITNDTVPT